MRGDALLFSALSVSSTLFQLSVPFFSFFGTLRATISAARDIMTVITKKAWSLSCTVLSILEDLADRACVSRLRGLGRNYSDKDALFEALVSSIF